MEVLVVTIFGGLVLVGIIVGIYNHTSHSKTNGKTLTKDASICNIETEHVGGRKALTAAIRTTVTFDDGFVYISHKNRTHMESPLYLQKTISVDRYVIEEIKKDAVDAHQKAYDQQSSNNISDCISYDENNNKPQNSHISDFDNNKESDLNNIPQANEGYFSKRFSDLFAPPYFKKLFEEISFINSYPLSEHIEFTIFALFKSKLCLLVMLNDSKMPEGQRNKVIDEYDLFQILSFSKWIEDNASSCDIDTNFLIKRFDLYHQVLFENKTAPIEMLESTLYWILHNGIKFDYTDSDFQTIKYHETIKETKQKYSSAYTQLDSLVFEFCKQNLPELVLFYIKNQGEKNEVK